MHVLAIAIAAAALLGVLIRPLRVNIAWWAAGGALLLVVSGALSARDAVSALARGLDVYLFLIGMMALAEFARREDVFTWAASAALVEMPWLMPEACRMRAPRTSASSTIAPFA